MALQLAMVPLGLKVWHSFSLEVYMKTNIDCLAVRMPDEPVTFHMVQNRCLTADEQTEQCIQLFLKVTSNHGNKGFILSFYAFVT